MVRFEEGEMEVAIVTYNRSRFVQEWLCLCHEELIKRNIELSIYDSSDDGKTEAFIKEYNKTHQLVDYISVSQETEIGYKPMLPILNSNARYIWVSGDSRYHDFTELDEKVFPFVKRGLEYIQIGIINNQKNDGKIYTNKAEFLRECFVSTTCIGLSIYNTAMFERLKQDADWMKLCDKKYRKNYGFGWLGYFYESFARSNYRAVFTVVDIYNIFPKKKKQSWTKRFYECWIENLYELMGNLPSIYAGKEHIPEETWKVMRLDSHAYCHRARINGGLSPKSFEKYMQNGMLEKVTGKIKRFHFYAYAPLWLVELIYYPNYMFYRMKNLMKKYACRWGRHGQMGK